MSIFRIKQYGVSATNNINSKTEDVTYFYPQVKETKTITKGIWWWKKQVKVERWFNIERRKDGSLWASNENSQTWFHSDLVYTETKQEAEDVIRQFIKECIVELKYKLAISGAKSEDPLYVTLHDFNFNEDNDNPIEYLHTLVGNHVAETFSEKMKAVSPIVANILKNNLKSRDDDNELILNVWEYQSDSEAKTYSFLKTLLEDDILSTPETITRTRRKLQEKHPELRGELYEARHRAEELMSKQMKLDFE